MPALISMSAAPRNGSGASATSSRSRTSANNALQRTKPAPVAAAQAAGIDRAEIAADPGLGFGKTLAHNLALLANISLFHGLGVPMLIGASRKRFIGGVGQNKDPRSRESGSHAAAIAAAAQGAHILRVHDVTGARQALAVWRAATPMRVVGAGVVGMTSGDGVRA